MAVELFPIYLYHYHRFVFSLSKYSCVIKILFIHKSDSLKDDRFYKMNFIIIEVRFVELKKNVTVKYEFISHF